MSESPDPIHRAAALARIPLSPAEAARVRAALDAGLGGPEAAPPAERSHPSADAAPERAQMRDAGALSDPLLLPPEALAPDWRDGFFLVPPLASAMDDSTPLASPRIVLPGIGGDAVDGPALDWRPAGDVVEAGTHAPGGEGR